MKERRRARADVTNSNPWTWAANDELIGAYIYESDAAP
jgi:hypothetical protein